MKFIVGGVSLLILLLGVCYWIFLPVIKSRKHKKIEYDVFDKYTLNNVKKPENKKEIFLSIVFPAYNEENRLKHTLDLAFAFLNNWSKRDKFSFEVIVVNDGSKDATVKVAKEYYDKYSDVFRLVSLRRNHGKGGAMKVGVSEALGQYILMADADGATEIEDAESLMKSMTALQKKFANNTGIVVGSRAHLADKSVATRAFYRTILMKGFHVLVTILCTRNIQDTQCGFKLFTNEVAKVIFENLHLNRWAFDIELIYQAEALGVHMDEVAVNWHEVEGSKLIQTKFDVVTTSLTMARDMLAVRLAYLFGFWKLPKSRTFSHSEL